MQPSFCRVWKEIGVAKWTWEVRPVLMIPMQRPSLVLLRNAGGHQPRPGPGLGITRIDKGGVNAALDKYLAGIDVTGKHRRDLAETLWPSILQEMSNGGALLSVDAKHTGTSWLKAGNVKQTVSVTRPLVSDVTFKFLHHLDEDGNMLPVTHKDPAFVDDWISDLNWILGAQANVWFEVQKAEPVKINTLLGRPVSDVAFKNYIAKEKDPFADVTVFLVGKWSGTGDAGGTFYPDPDNVIALDDKPVIPVVEGNDPFIVTLAHELVHYVLAYRGNKENIHHLPDQHALLNKLVESTVVTPQLQRALGPA
jgi:hypothetical protein